jgi:lipid-binding SYLF domain-containing protein
MPQYWCKETGMKSMLRMCIVAGALGIPVGAAQASNDSDAISLFSNADQSAGYFGNSYGYAVLPTIGKGGLGIGAAHGSGHVYRHGRLIGHVTMNQISVGAQAGGEAYSEIIFFEDRRSLNEFTAGNFEFSGDVGATLITASASASVGTTGENSGASADKKVAETQGQYHGGMAVFTIAKGGLMYNATIEGQKFSYEPR